MSIKSSRRAPTTTRICTATIVKAIFFILLHVPSVWLAGQKCYFMTVHSFRTTETPEYRFVMQLHANHSLSSVTRVLKDVTIPVWNLVLVQYNKDGRNRHLPKRILYNSTLKICDFWRATRRIRIFANLGETLFNLDNGSNMSLTCPLKAGTYLMNDIRVPPDTPVLKLIYSPNSKLGLFGNVYSMLPDKRKILKCSYEINGSVIKKC